jgi:hypothetical protein
MSGDYEAHAAARERLLSAAARRIPQASAASQARALGLWNGKEVHFANEAQFQLVLDLGVLGPVGGHSRALDREARQAHDDEGRTRVLAAPGAAHFTLFRSRGRTQRRRARRGPLRDTRCACDPMLERREFGAALRRPLMHLDGMEMTCGARALTDEVIERLRPSRRVLPAPPAAALTPLLPEECRRCGRRRWPADFPARVYRTSLEHGLLGMRPD